MNNLEEKLELHLEDKNKSNLLVAGSFAILTGFADAVCTHYGIESGRSIFLEGNHYANILIQNLGSVNGLILQKATMIPLVIGIAIRTKKPSLLYALSSLQAFCAGAWYESLK